MKTSSWRLAAIVLLFAGAIVGAQQRNGLDVQKARNEHVAARAKKVYYTTRWDLSDLPEYHPAEQVSGDIRQWVSNYFQDSNLGEYWEGAFHQYQPEVVFHDNMRTALEASAALSTGVANLVACRAFTFQEEELFERAYGHEPLRILVATGSYNVPGWSPALVIVVNKDNPLGHLTMKQLDGIFGAARTGGYRGTTWEVDAARPASENIRTWGQLGLGGKWKNAPIHLYGLNLKYGMAQDFEQLVFHGGDKWSESLVEYANYSKADGSLSIGADQLMHDLSKDPYGIGYSGAMFLTPQTKILSIASSNSGPYIPLNIQTVRDRTYPLLLDVYYYLNREPGHPVDPKLKEYIKFVLSRQGQEAVMRDGKYLPLTRKAVEQGLRQLE